MRKRKNVIYLLFAIVLILLLGLMGCGKANSTNVNPSPGPGPTPLTWRILGGVSGVSAGGVLTPSLGIDSSGVVYVAYRDTNSPYKLIVQKWNGTSWSYLGAENGISAGAVNDSPSLGIDSSGDVYVAYRDDANLGKLTVQKWNGTVWSPLEGVGVSAGQVNKPSLGIDSSKNVYVAYTGSSPYKLIVQKWDGNENEWSYVGAGTGITVGMAASPSLGIDSSGNVYVAYQNGTPRKLTVQKWSEGSWSEVGSADISAGAVWSPSLGIDSSGNVYVAYIGPDPYKLIIQKWNGNEWSYVGESTGITAGESETPSLGIYNNKLFVGAKDGSSGGKLTVMTYQ